MTLVINQFLVIFFTDSTKKACIISIETQTGQDGTPVTKSPVPVNTQPVGINCGKA